MALGTSGRRNEPLNVIAMALSLALAAFVGAALGLAWHAVGSEDDEDVQAAAGARGE